MKDFCQISIRPSTIARLLGTVALILVMGSIAGQFSKYVLGHPTLRGLVYLFNLDEEENLPAYFSLLLMLISALLLALAAAINKRRNLPQVSKWVVLSLGFLLMSYDEVFSLHEQLVLPVRKLLGGNNLGIFYYAWVIPGIALVFFLGCYFYSFLLRLPTKTRLRFLISAILYLGGCIGFELIGGKYTELYGDQSLTYALIATVEESLEMSGLIVFIWALLKYFLEEFRELRVRFDFTPDQSNQNMNNGILSTVRQQD